MHRHARQRWYRQLVAAKYDGSKRRGPGRPRIGDELRALVVSLAVENPSWGYTRLRDVLRTLGHEIGRTTIQTILKEQGIARSRPRETDVLERVSKSPLGRSRGLGLPHGGSSHDAGPRPLPCSHRH
ncbi:MAG: helix-turn-helix domain-containing protein [Myxococcales bacterium]|nr:helix-turn-helix domain-containing protein [Myxococcales bacterium]